MSLPSSFKPIQGSKQDAFTIGQEGLSSVGQSPQMPSSFKLRQKKQPEEEIQISEDIEFPYEGENDLEREIERSQAQLTSRAIERVAGLPGDIAQLLPDWLTENLGLNKLPTSEKLQEYSEKATRGYTRPKTEVEKEGGELFGDIASFGVGGAGKSALSTLGRVVGVPLSGYLAKQGVKSSGGSESTQNKVKNGLMLIGSLASLRKGGVKQFGFKKLDEAKKSIPKGAMADASVLGKKVSSLENSLTKGVTGPHTSEAQRVIKEIKNHIKGGKIEVSKLPKIREDINKLIEAQKGFQIGGLPTSVRKASVSNLNDVKKAIIQAGNRWGRGNNKKFFKDWKEGNEALAVYYKSKDIANYIGKHSKIKNPVLRTMLGVGAYHHPATALAYHGLKKGADLAVRGTVGYPYRILKSPVLRKYYFDILGAAAKENAQTVSRLTQKLDKEMEKEKYSK